MRHALHLLPALALCAASAFADRPIPSVTASDLPRHVNQTICVSGLVRDIFPDERDADYTFLVIQTETGPVYAAFAPRSALPSARELVGAAVSATGVCRETNHNLQPRHHIGYVLDFHGGRGLVITRPAPSDPFLVPEIDEGTHLGPLQLQQLGRHRARGRVLAAWKGGNVLLQTQSNRLMRVELSGPRTPAVGEFVETAGFPDTDIYRLNLTRAIWRQTDGWPCKDEPVRNRTAAEILTDGRGNPLVSTDMYGKPVRLVGTVRTLPGELENAVVQIDNNGHLLSLDASSCPEALEGLVLGSTVEATGVCILNIDNCRPNDIFPQSRGFTLVLRKATDLAILSRPPWWTTRRLAVALLIVLVLLIAILIWNRSLSVLAERRGRQLAEEQVGRATSELKVLERTRFSAELHDALSQTLSGIAMQLGAIKRFAKTDPEQMLQHLDIASRTLKSCRDEMRNLLWDLRSQVLDEPDIEKALRQILEPHLEETDVRIRFAVPRARLTDSTARALFCIVRELTVNAIRHGHATAVRIAGSLENGRLLCSVRDNGRGFDPSTAPGAEEGHFGLQGIRERMDALDGTFTIESTRDKGTKVTISLAAPHEEEKT